MYFCLNKQSLINKFNNTIIFQDAAHDVILPAKTPSWQLRTLVVHRISLIRLVGMNVNGIEIGNVNCLTRVWVSVVNQVTVWISFLISLTFLSRTCCGRSLFNSRCSWHSPVGLWHRFRFRKAGPWNGEVFNASTGKVSVPDLFKKLCVCNDIRSFQKCGQRAHGFVASSVEHRQSFANGAQQATFHR